MQKRPILTIILTIILTSLVSAYSFLDNFMYNIGGYPTLIYTILFLFFFFFISKALSKFFSENMGISRILSFLLSFAMVYGIYTLELDVESWLYIFGIPSELFTIILGMIILVLIFFISISKDKYGKKSFKFYRTVILIGIAIIGASFLSYNGEIIKIIGFIIFIIGLWLWRRKKKKEQKEKMYPYEIPTPPERKQGFFNKNPKKRLQDYRYNGREMIERAQREKQETQRKQRNLYDLKQKYMAYLFSYHKFSKKDESGKLTQSYKRERIRKVMNQIIKEAKKLGISKKNFLSSKIGGSNAKAPEDLKP